MGKLQRIAAAAHLHGLSTPGQSRGRQLNPSWMVADINTSGVAG